MNLDTLSFIAALAGAGLSAGFVGGLFGVGGGVVIVPALFYLYGVLGIDDAVRMHAAIGASLSTIIATSARSLHAHAKRGAVDFTVLRSWAPWIALGAAIGAALAGAIDARGLRIVFGGGLLIVAAQMGLVNPRWKLAENLPTGWGRAALAGGLGALSAMMGIGGGAFGVAIMTLCNRPIHTAVATASGFGAAIALPGMIGFMISGWGEPGLPWGSLGYVNMPAFAVMALLTTLTAPLGARMAHALDQAALKRAFAVFLALTAAHMLYGALFD